MKKGQNQLENTDRVVVSPSILEKTRSEIQTWDIGTLPIFDLLIDW